IGQLQSLRLLLNVIGEASRSFNMAEGGVEQDRHYIFGQQISVEEDLAHEFKGHRSISILDIPNLCLHSSTGSDRTRNSVSTSICGMLNSGLGGTVYLGVTDNGIVRGISLTRYQKDHIEASVKWTLDKFTPPVPENRYCVTFVPVSSSKTHSIQNFKEQPIDSKRREQPHHVGHPNYCWCDLDASALHSLGKMSMIYVIEIHIRPWDPHLMKELRNPLYSDAPPLPPLFLNEACGCFVRQTCRQPRLCLEDVRSLLVHRIQEHCYLKLSRLHEQYELLQQMAINHGLSSDISHQKEGKNVY
ncbi:hypothetical protein SK128_007101, partial [Halocaridina rubra]